MYRDLVCCNIRVSAGFQEGQINILVVDASFVSRGFCNWKDIPYSRKLSREKLLRMVGNKKFVRKLSWIARCH